GIPAPPLERAAGDVGIAVDVDIVAEDDGAVAHRFVGGVGPGFLGNGGGIEFPLGEGDVAGRLDEGGELGVGHLGLVNPEGADDRTVGGFFLGEILRAVGGLEFAVVAHRIGAAGQADHAV